MKFKIEHEARKRIRIHFMQAYMTCEEADLFQYYMQCRSLYYLQSGKRERAILP